MEIKRHEVVFNENGEPDVFKAGIIRQGSKNVDMLSVRFENYNDMELVAVVGGERFDGEKVPAGLLFIPEKDEATGYVWYNFIFGQQEDEGNPNSWFTEIDGDLLLNIRLVKGKQVYVDSQIKMEVEYDSGFETGGEYGWNIISGFLEALSMRATYDYVDSEIEEVITDMVAVDNDLQAHKNDTSAHNIPNQIDSKINTHNQSGSSHQDLRTGLSEVQSVATSNKNKLDTIDFNNVIEKVIISGITMQVIDRGIDITDDVQEMIDITVYEEINRLIGDAPETLDTLQELAEAFQNNPDIINTILYRIDNLTASEITTNNGITVQAELDKKVDIDLIETQLPDNLVYSDDLEEVEEPLIQVYNSQLLNDKQESELDVNSAIKDGDNNVIADTYYKKTDTVYNSTNSENADKLLQNGSYVGSQFLNVAHASNASKLGGFEPSHYATKDDLLTDMQLAISIVSVVYAYNLFIEDGYTKEDFIVGLENQQYLIIEDNILNGSSVDIEFLVIPNNVTSIGQYAFNENQLKSVVIPNSVTSISGVAFSNNQLTSVVIPNSVTSIGYGVFMNNQLTSVVIGNSVISISQSAFQNNQLTSIVIPNGVTSIDMSAFSSNQLTEIIFERNTPPTIQSSTFNNNPDLLTQGSIYVPDIAVNTYKTAQNYTQFASIIKPISERGGN